MDRIIAAAKREARRRARTDGRPLQGHLDAIAVEAGRRHWADFLRSPVDVADNPLDRLIRETAEDGYDGLEIDIGEHVPADLQPAVARAFRLEDGELRIDHFRMGWDDVVHLGPAIRRRFERPDNNANLSAICLGRPTLLYNHMDVIIAFEFNCNGTWQQTHSISIDDSLKDAPPVTPWWRERKGRPLDEVVADQALHARHVRKLATILASPDAPPGRYDAYSRTEVPSCHPRLALAHFLAVADLIIPDGPDAAGIRARFARASMAVKDRRVQCFWGDRNGGLNEMTDHMVAGPIRTRLLLDPEGALAHAVDGEGERFRTLKARMDREEEVHRRYLLAHPVPDLKSSEYHEWMKATDLADDDYRTWLSNRITVDDVLSS